MALEKNPNPLDDRRKAQEEEYFRNESAALAARLKARLAMTEGGISDEKLVDELEKAGFTADSARALLLVPLIQVAWADGRVQAEEKKAILEFATQRGIEDNSEAMKLIKNWIEREPSGEKFVRAKLLVEPIVSELQKTGNADASEWIIESARQVAKATGSLFGFGSKVSKEEEDLLRKISQDLKK